MKTIIGKSTIIQTNEYKVSDDIYEQIMDGTLALSFLSSETLHLHKADNREEEVLVEGGSIIDTEYDEDALDEIYTEDMIAIE